MIHYLLLICISVFNDEHFLFISYCVSIITQVKFMCLMAISKVCILLSFFPLFLNVFLVEASFLLLGVRACVCVYVQRGIAFLVH